MNHNEDVNRNDDVPAFFKDFGLEFSADERSVKRAYSKALKQIDQENDLVGFQDLRESYEYALNWLRHRDWYEQRKQESQRERETEQKQPELQAQELIDTAEQVQQVTLGSEDKENIAEDPVAETEVLGSAVVDLKYSSSYAADVLSIQAPTDGDGLSQSMDKSGQAQRRRSVSIENRKLILAQQQTIDQQNDATRVEVNDTLSGGNTSAQTFFRPEELPPPIDLARAVQADVLRDLRALANENIDATPILERALDDERLINVEARDLFEWLMASYLAEGWKRGNGNMFSTVVKCFHWKQDRNRLLRYGELGYYLQRALLELIGFEEQAMTVSERQMYVICCARESGAPDDKFLKEHLSSLIILTENFPNWLYLITNLEQLRSWRERAEKLKDEVPSVAATNGTMRWTVGEEQPDLSYKIPLNSKNEESVKEEQEAPSANESKSVEFPKERSNFLASPMFWYLLAFLLLLVFKGCVPNRSAENSKKANEVNLISERQHKLNHLLDPVQSNYQRGEDAFFGRNGMKRDYKLAERIWLRCAEKEVTDCMARLSDLYSLSETGLSDPVAAHKYRELAAQRGRARFYFDLAQDFSSGIGTKKDDEKAFYWMKKASDDSGKPEARYELAFFYEFGLGTPKDKQLAWKNYYHAATQGLPIAMEKVGLSLLNGNINLPLNRAEGLAYLRKSADKDFAPAEYDLGKIYELGQFQQVKDLELAGQWYARAAKHHHEEAQLQLKKLCRSKRLEACNALGET